MPYMTLFDQKIILRTLALLLVSGLSLHAAAPLFARLSPDRTTIHAGEAFQVTLAIYVTGETLAPQISIDALPAPDTLQLYPFQELPNETTTLDGSPYEVRKFRAWARAPKAGRISLGPRLNGTFIQTSRSFFFMQETRRPANIPVEPLALSIQPLPEVGRPVDFTGLVGWFSFSTVPAPLNIAPGDLITLTFTIEGDLLPDLYRKPEIKPSPDLKVYELKPVAAESTPTRHVFTQIIVPGNNTITSVPACSLSFFDTRQKRYKTLTAGPFPIHYHTERAPLQTVYAPTQTTVKAGTTNISTPPPPTASMSLWTRFWHRLGNVKPATISGTNEVQVYLSPTESSKILFTLKPGSLVTLGTTNENWVYVSSPNGMGWLPASEITPL